MLQIRGVIFLSVLYVSTSLCAPLKITNSNGEDLNLNTPINRVISLAPSITELVFSAGGGGKLVGIDMMSDFPIATKSIAKVASFNFVNLEEIIKLQPDLILAWHANNHQTIKQLKQLNFKVLTLKTDNLINMKKSFNTLIRIFENDSAKQKLQNFQNDLTKLKPKKANLKKVFIQISDKPLMTLNQHSFFSRVVKFCGGQNIFGTMTQIAPQINIEKVLQKNPDIILISNGKHKIWQNWQQITAVKNQQIFKVNPDLINRATLRSIQAIAKICKIIN